MINNKRNDKGNNKGLYKIDRIMKNGGAYGKNHKKLV